MIDDPVVWTVAIVLIAGVVLVALWWGDVVEFSVKGLRLKFSRTRGGPKRVGRGVSVLDGANIKGSRTGDIAGVVGDGAAANSVERVDVGSKARIDDSTIGDIVGVRDAPPAKGPTKTKRDSKP